MTGQCHTKKQHYKEKGTIEYEIASIEKTLRVISKSGRSSSLFNVLWDFETCRHTYLGIFATPQLDHVISIIDVNLLPGCTNTPST
jgi:hypothetical protein